MKICKEAEKWDDRSVKKLFEYGEKVGNLNENLTKNELNEIKDEYKDMSDLVSSLLDKFDTLTDDRSFLIFSDITSVVKKCGIKFYYDINPEKQKPIMFKPTRQYQKL